MSGKIGIDGIKACMKVLTTTTNIGFEALADGSISLADSVLLMKLVQPIASLVPLASQIPAEADDLQPEELDELVQYGITDLSMAPEHVKPVISASLKWLRASADLGMAIATAVKKPAAEAAPAAPTA